MTLNDLQAYLPADAKALEASDLEVHYLGYYLKWTPQECYYYAAEHTGFQANPFRTEGTYSKYNSLDDKIDGFHYYTTWIKFGLGRATYDASQEIRNQHLTREEGVALVQRFDGEFPGQAFPGDHGLLGDEAGPFHGAVRQIPLAPPMEKRGRRLAAAPSRLGRAGRCRAA